MICTYLAHMCIFPPKEDSSVFPRLVFKEQEHIIFVGLIIKICNNPPCSLKYNCNIWLYSTLMKAEFNVTTPPPQNQHLDGKNTQVHIYLLYPKFNQYKSQEGVALGPLIVACEWGNNNTCILGCLNQRNKNC